MRRLWPVLAMLAAAGCQDDLAEQPKLTIYEPSAIWADGAAARPLPEGVVARGGPGMADLRTAPPVTGATMARGRERYGIFCTPCHGATGAGDGRVVLRGFPRPPSFLSARLRTAPAAHFVRVMTRGYGVMYSYDDRLAPADRWAVAAYIRALQAASPRLAPDHPARALVKVEPADG